METKVTVRCDDYYVTIRNDKGASWTFQTEEWLCENYVSAHAAAAFIAQTMLTATLTAVLHHSPNGNYEFTLKAEKL